MFWVITAMNHKWYMLQRSGVSVVSLACSLSLCRKHPMYCICLLKTGNKNRNYTLNQELIKKMSERSGAKTRGHPGLNQGPLDLQSNALPLSYIPLRLAIVVLGNYR